jgi:CDP-diacylglycerol--serine O-phosphatidyltransferase
MFRMGQMRKRRPRRSIAMLREDLSIGRFLPSGLTLLGLCTGATAIRFALSGHWQAAVVAIVLAAVLDTMDGSLARLLHLDSKFGAQLDSLADLVSFGIAPSVLVYMWTLYQGDGAGWTIALAFCACCAIRLARFNVESAEAEEEDDGDAPATFSGVPAPAAACLILLPMLLEFQFKLPILRDPFVNGGLMALVSLLMVSRLPTPSLKRMYVPAHLKAPVLAAVCLLATCLILWPWATLTAALLLYIAALPFGRRPPGKIRRSFTRPPNPPADS